MPWTQPAFGNPTTQTRIELLKRIYGYAAWSFDQTGGDLAEILDKIGTSASATTGITESAPS